MEIMRTVNIIIKNGYQGTWENKQCKELEKTPFIWGVYCNLKANPLGQLSKHYNSDLRKKTILFDFKLYKLLWIIKIHP